MLLKLLANAKQSRRSRKEMSFLRRLICQGRALLAEYQLFGYHRCYNGGQPDWRFLKIELPPRTKGIGGGSVNPFSKSARCPSLSLPELSNASIGRVHATQTRAGSPVSTTLQWVGQEFRKIFVNNVLKRVTTNEQVAKQTAQRLLYGDSRPFFALVGVSLAAGTTGMLTQESEFDNLCWEIREAMRKKPTASTPSDVESPQVEISVTDLKFGNLIKQGCNAAVYSAEWTENSSQATDRNELLAVKMLFNYDIESNASSILRAMVREIVPARNINLKNVHELDQGIFGSVKRCPPHDNIIEITHAFVDRIPILPGSENYPSALPRRLNPIDGLGRNMSLFLVMKRYECNLAEFLSSRKDGLTFKIRMIIFTQLLDAVGHLERCKIAHRDLKTDNILVDLSSGETSPRIVLTDFGCCLADKTNALQLAFRSYDTERGGNAALMAPEVSTAVPGSWKWISYEKSDAWSVGAMAYEIFGQPNPFYRSERTEKPLDSRTYTEADLKEIDADLPPTVINLVYALLKRNANERLSAQEAAVIAHIHLWAPTNWLNGNGPASDDEIMQWLVTLTTKALCHGSEELEFRMIRNFLRKIKFRDVRNAIDWFKANH